MSEKIRPVVNCQESRGLPYAMPDLGWTEIEVIDEDLIVWANRPAWALRFGAFGPLDRGAFRGESRVYLPSWSM